MNAANPKPVLILSNPAGLYDPAPNGYSHVAEVAGAVRWVFVAGQGGETADGALADDFQAQVRQAMHNLVIALRSAGASPSDVVKLTVLIVDHSEARLHTFGAELAAAFGSEHRPTCTLIPVPRLALDGMLFEIEALAAVAAT
ncbi:MULTISPECIES: RidA family protein [Lysobacter]|uniref:RidA family protein n=1 Tax=Lysobacter TaxID=68 RepID=UPI0004D02027|nr:MULTISPECIES: RidA family protein [Lysobacter]